MRGDASPAATYHPYNGLMARLAALARRPGRRAVRRAVGRSPGASAYASSTKYFSCGFVASLASRLRGHAARRCWPTLEYDWPAASLSRWRPISVAPRYPCGRLTARSLSRPRSAPSNCPSGAASATSAAFPVEITGGGAARDGMTVVLRDMPEVDLPVQRTAPGRQHLAAAAGRPQQPAPVDLRGHAGRLRRDHRSDVRHRRSGGTQHRPRPPARHAGAARAARRSASTRCRCTRRSRPSMPASLRGARKPGQAATAGDGTAAEERHRSRSWCRRRGPPSGSRSFASYRARVRRA